MKTKLITLLLLFIPIIAWGEASPTPAPDKLQSALADIVNKSVQVAGDAKDFLVAQLPDVIRQLLLWKFFEHIVPMAFFFLMLLLALSRIGALIKAGDFDPVPHKREDGYVSDYTVDPKNGYPRMIWGVIKCVLGLVSLIAFLISINLTWLQIWLAPKVYLIEYSKTFITGH